MNEHEELEFLRKQLADIKAAWAEFDKAVMEGMEYSAYSNMSINVGDAFDHLKSVIEKDK